MTVQEIIARIDKLEEEQFILEMKDVWNSRDYARDRALTEEIKALRAKLEE